MATRLKHWRRVFKPFRYGTSVFDYRQNGPTKPMFICVCPTCGHKEQHTNRESIHYCLGFNVASEGRSHTSVRMVWED